MDLCFDCLICILTVLYVALTGLYVQVNTDTHFARIAVGNGHCLAVDRKGQMFMWGDSESAILDKQVPTRAKETDF